MKTLTLQGFPKQLKQVSNQSQRTDTSPVQSGKPSHPTQLQEKAFRQVKHLHKTYQANHAQTSVRAIANIYFLERRIFW